MWLCGTCDREARRGTDGCVSAHRSSIEANPLNFRTPSLSAALVTTVILLGTGAAPGEPLLHVQGANLKWGRTELGTGALVTYAMVTGSYSVPSGQAILNSDNCNAMHGYADIGKLSPDMTPGMVEPELRAAFAAWTAAADITFVKVDDVLHANIVIGAADREHGRGFANLSYHDGPGAAPVARGQVAKGLDNANPEPSIDPAQKPITRRDFGASTAITHAYICLNPGARWKVGFDGSLDIYDLRYTFMHEIGHAIGLDHPGSSGSIMAYRYDERVSDLQASDIAAAQKLYGPARH